MFELFELFFILVLLILSFIYSGSEVSIFSISHVDKIKLSREQNRRGKLLNSYVNSPTKALITILVGNMVVNLTASIVGESLSNTVFYKHPMFYSVFIMSFTIIIFGEVLPKNIAATRPVQFGKRFISVINITNKIFFPFIYFLSRIITSKKSDRDEHIYRDRLSKDELISAIDVTSEVGLDTTSISVLRNLVDLIDKPVTELMIPRSNIQAFDINIKWSELTDKVKELGIGEILFYRENIDNIVGYITKEKLLFLRKKDLKKELKEPLFIPETKSILNLLTDFKKNNEFLAVILDEYGGTAGLITVKDILDYIFVRDILVGSDIVKVGEKKWKINGETPVSVVNSYFHLDLPTENNTISGYVINKTGYIPPSGTEIKLDDEYLVKIVRSNEKQIESLEIVKID